MARLPRLVCTSCEHKSPRSMQFCGHCGTAFAAQPAPNPAPIPAPRPRAPSGDRRLLTIAFFDLVGSTRLAAALDPEDLRTVLLAFREACVEPVERLGGTVAQYLGDGILTYFGYPRAHEDDGRRAVRAALLAREATAKAGAHLAGLGLSLPASLALRVGVHSGVVVVADLGHGRRAESASIVGEATSIAARLQSAAQGGSILVSDATARLVAGSFLLSGPTSHTLPGIEHPLAAFEVLEERPSTRSGPTGPEPDGTPFLSRVPEMLELRRQWHEAAAGRGTVVTIRGEAGMGKTRLVDEFRLSLGQAGRDAVILTCEQADAGTPFQPVRTWLRHSLHLPPGAGKTATHAALDDALAHDAPGATGRVAPLAAMLDCATEEEERALAENPRRRRRRTLDALVAHLSDGTRRRPPVLQVVEDVHWADDSTTALISAFADLCRTGWAGLVLLTERPDATAHPAPHAAPLGPILQLGRLPDTDIRRLVEAVAPPATDARILEAIVQRTDGIPLFAEEMARSAAAPAPGRNRREGSDLPIGLRSALTSRLDDLGDAKDVAQLASVIGRSFPTDLLAAIADESAPALQAALHRLVAARFLEPQEIPLAAPDSAPEAPAGYAFRHALLRDAAYDSLLRDRRRALHLEAATALARLFPARAAARPELLGHHYAEAGHPAEAAAQYERAAQQMGAQSSHVEAAEHCRTALALLRQIPPNPGTDTAAAVIRLHTMLAAQVTATRGNADPEVRDAFEQACQAAEAAGDDRLLRRALRGLHTAHLVRGNIAAGHAISERVMELGRHETDPAQRIQLHRPHGLTLLYMGRFEQARTELRIVTALYRAADHANQRFEYGSDADVLARCHLGWAEWFLGDTAAAIDSCTSAIDHARALAHPHSLAFALAFHACLNQFMHDPAATHACAKELLALAGRHDYAYWEAWSEILLGWSHIALSEPGEGERTLRDGINRYQATGAGLLTPYATMLLASAVAPRDPQLHDDLAAEARHLAREGAMGIWDALFARPDWMAAAGHPNTNGPTT